MQEISPFIAVMAAALTDAATCIEGNGGTVHPAVYALIQRVQLGTPIPDDVADRLTVGVTAIGVAHIFELVEKETPASDEHGSGESCDVCEKIAELHEEVLGESIDDTADAEAYRKTFEFARKFRGIRDLIAE